LPRLELERRAQQADEVPPPRALREGRSEDAPVEVDHERPLAGEEDVLDVQVRVIDARVVEPAHGLAGRGERAPPLRALRLEEDALEVARVLDLARRDRMEEADAAPMRD